MADVTPIRDLRDLGITRPGKLNINWLEPALYEEAIRRGEGRVAKGGALAVETGQHTGRSARDKFTVRDANTENTIWWDFNAAMSPEHFDALWADMRAHMEDRELFVQELFGGADKTHRLPVRVVTELAWHSLFIRHLLRRPDTPDLQDFAPEFTIINLPSFKADPKRHGCRSETVIAINFTEKLVLIGGTSYAGETKKSVFSILNYLLPEKHVMPMHCSVNVGEKGDSAVFFGLSGTGKTTLSADPKRKLIGDDEHGWSETGLFNFEGGCYAKMIRLSKEAEPDIYATTAMWGTVLENVVMDADSRIPDYKDVSLTQNTRAAYPLENVEKRVIENQAGEPKHIIFLTCDLTGVLPPVSKLSREAAAYHFLSGYTALVGSTEMGAGSGIKSTFSTCFGAPFFPRRAGEYAELLMKRMDEFGSQVYLVNTGWTGGPYGEGERFSIPTTRGVVNAILSGALDNAETQHLDIINLEVPKEVPGVDSNLLVPKNTWKNPDNYEARARDLAEQFNRNFAEKYADVSEDIRNAGPRIG